jgi:hypothetical protein
VEAPGYWALCYSSFEYASFRQGQSQPQYRPCSAAGARRSGPRTTSWLRLGAGILGLGRPPARLEGRALGCGTSRVLLGTGALGGVLGAKRSALAFRARALGARASASLLMTSRPCGCLACPSVFSLAESADQNRWRRVASSPRTRKGVAAVVTVSTSPRPREKRRWGPSMKRRPRRVLEVTSSGVSGPTIPRSRQ